MISFRILEQEVQALVLVPLELLCCFKVVFELFKAEVK